MLTDEQSQQLTAALEALPPGTKERDAYAACCGAQPRFEDFVHAYGRLRDPRYRAIAARLLAAIAAGGDAVLDEPMQPLFRRLFPEAVSHSDFRDVFQALQKRRQDASAWIDPPAPVAAEPEPVILKFAPEKNRGKRKKSDPLSAISVQPDTAAAPES